MIKNDTSQPTESSMRFRLTMNSAGCGGTAAVAVEGLMQNQPLAGLLVGVCIFCACGFVLSCIDYANFLKKQS